MAVDLKALLGDKYTDEIALALEGVTDKLLLNDGSYIPKKRFDEVNDKLKERIAKDEQERLNKLTEEEKVKEALKQAESAKKEFTLKSNKLEVEKIFVQAGVKDYTNYIDNIVGEDLEKSLKVAGDIVSTFKSALSEKEAELEKLRLQTITKPEKGDGTAGNPEKLNYTQLAELKAKDPVKYDAYMKSQK